MSQAVRAVQISLGGDPPVISPTPTVVGEGCVGQKRSVPEDGPSGTESITRYGRYGPRRPRS